MRLPLLTPAELSAEQKPLYEDMRTGIAQKFNDFKTIDKNGSLLGPWNPWLHEPAIGGAVWNLTKAMSMQASLPDTIRQIVILVVGADFDAAYEIYAHVAMAERDGMSEERIQQLIAGEKPDDFTDEEETAYDVAFTLVGGGVLPDALYARAVAAFGQHGAYELITLVGLYCLVSVMLNGFDVPVPEDDD